MEVTDWTAAPTALLAGEQPLHSAVPQARDLAHMAAMPTPCPGGWGQSWEPRSSTVVHGLSPVSPTGPRSRHSPRHEAVLGDCTASPPVSPARILRARSSLTPPALRRSVDLSLHRLRPAPPLLCTGRPCTGAARHGAYSTVGHGSLPWSLAASWAPPRCCCGLELGAQSEETETTPESPMGGRTW